MGRGLVYVLAPLVLFFYCGVGAHDYAGTMTWHNAGDLDTPDVLSSSGGWLNVSLIVDAYRWPAYISMTTRAYYFNGKVSVPGPTLRVKPGDLLMVTLINNLANTGADDVSLADVNGFHSPNTTGFFLHGVRASPAENSAFTRVPPGAWHTYIISIPADHPVGVYWYYDPTHGSSSMHVMGGLFGAFYVDAPDWWSPPPPLDGSITSNLLLLHHLAVWTEAQAADSAEPPLNYMIFSELTGSTLSVNPDFADDSIPDMYLVNGQFQPMINMRTGELRQLDVVHAAGSPYQLELELRSVGGGLPITACTMSLVALDGIYLTQPRTVTMLPLAAGQRASLLLTCSEASIYYLYSWANNQTRPAGSGFTAEVLRYQQNLVTLSVSGKKTTTPDLPDLSTIPRPLYLTDLQTDPADLAINKWELSTKQRGVSSAESPSITVIGVGENCNDTSIGECLWQAFWGPQGQPYWKYRHTATSAVVEEVTVYGHISSQDALFFQSGPFQILSFEPEHEEFGDIYSTWWGQYGDWRDTLPPLRGTFVIRYLVSSDAGEYAVGSTYLPNQDTGLLDSFWAGPDEPFTLFPRMITRAPTLTPTTFPTSSPTASPTPSPTLSPTALPTASPTLYPTFQPTLAPTPLPTATPTIHPTRAPTNSPTHRPTFAPTPSPTTRPTGTPTTAPTMLPTATPTMRPTFSPSASPTLAPTTAPTMYPTFVPTRDPTWSPTPSPTYRPTLLPTANPTVAPTPYPTTSPTFSPTPFPTLAPTPYPTATPTASPTASPTLSPTLAPTTASPTFAPTPTPILELTVEVWGSSDLEALQTSHVASVFSQTIGSRYEVTVFRGSTVNVRRRRRAQSDAAAAAAVGEEDDTSATGGVVVAGGDRETGKQPYMVDGALEDKTLGTLFEHGRLSSKRCEVEGFTTTRIPLYIFVRGANMTITSSYGLKVIKALSTISFSDLLGSPASDGLCGASVNSVMQVESIDPTPAPTGSLGVTTPAPTPAPASSDPGSAATSGDQGTTSSGNSGLRTPGVTEGAKDAMIAIGVVGTVAILLGAVYYGKRLMRRQGQSEGAVTMWIRPNSERDYRARAEFYGA